MWTKIIGSILLILSSSGIGYLSGQDITYRIDDLKTLCRMLQMLQGEITYTKAPLGEAFFRIGNRLETPFKDWLLHLAKICKEGDKSVFVSKWNRTITQDMKDSNLSRRDMEQLKRFGGQIGLSNVEMQVNMIAMYQEQVEQDISKLEENLSGQLKIRRCLGIVVGVLLVALLF